MKIKIYQILAICALAGFMAGSAFAATFNIVAPVPPASMRICTIDFSDCGSNVGDACTAGELAFDGTDLLVCGTGGTLTYLSPWMQEGTNVLLTDGTNRDDINVGIAIATPLFPLHLGGEDGTFVGEGTFGSPVIAALPTGAGTRMIWRPRKAAFRAGTVTGAQWDEANIGNYSAAFGLDNQAGGLASVINGGSLNTVSGPYTTIGGGTQNTVATSFSTISGGESNTLPDGGGGVLAHSTIGGGRLNTMAIDTARSTISGGESNTINADHGSIGGGMTNTVNGLRGTVGGGQSNIANNTHTTVSGGSSNQANADYSAIGGGQTNTITGDNSTIGGGSGNTITLATTSTIGGGLTNVIGLGGAMSNATVGGGGSNTADGDGATVSGGVSNSISTGSYSTIAGGRDNSLDGNYSFAVGHNNHSISNYTATMGRNVTNNGARSFVWGTPAGAVTVGQSDTFWIYDDAVGIGPTADPNGNSVGLHVAGADTLLGGSLTITTVEDKTLLIATPGERDLGWDVSNGTLWYRDDLAELFPSSEGVGPGDVLVMDEGVDKLMLKKSYKAYAKTAVGVVSRAPAILFEGSSLKMSPPLATEEETTKPPVALAGRVLVKVSLEGGPIRRGDLLVTSSTPGHAMKAADPAKAFGAVIGKALQPFDGTKATNKNSKKNKDNKKTTGIILMLVALQ